MTNLLYFDLIRILYTNFTIIKSENEFQSLFPQNSFSTIAEEQDEIDETISRHKPIQTNDILLRFTSKHYGTHGEVELFFSRSNELVNVRTQLYFKNNNERSYFESTIMDKFFISLFGNPKPRTIYNIQTKVVIHDNLLISYSSFSSVINLAIMLEKYS